MPAARPAGRGPGRGLEPPLWHQPGTFHEGCEPVAEVRGMPRVQVELVGSAIDTELHGLIGRAAGEIVLQLYFDLLHCFPPS